MTHWCWPQFMMTHEMCSTFRHPWRWPWIDLSMMTSSNGNIFRVTGHLCGEFPVNSPHKDQWRGALMFTLICDRINGWVNNRGAGDLRRNSAHYDVIGMGPAHMVEGGQNLRKAPNPIHLYNLRWSELVQRLWSYSICNMDGQMVGQMVRQRDGDYFILMI